jgi:hypothetical protein
MSDCESVDSSDIPFSADNEPMAIDGDIPTSRSRRPTPPPRIPEPEYVSFMWPRFVERGNTYYKYMIEHFDDMFDGGSIIKHFSIFGYGLEGLGEEAEEIYEKYGNDIHKSLVPWIHKEHQTGRLFEKSNWNPERDIDCGTNMYLEYRILYNYNEKYFNLIMDDCCGECPYCINTHRVIHFKLLFRGSKDKHTGYFIQYRFTQLMPDGTTIDTDFNQ